jgi:F-type H+-transporting ATPase subunit gamma
MASLQEYKLKLKSLKSTHKIAGAMKLVATSKLFKAQTALKSNQPYAQKLNEIFQKIIHDELTDPLLTVRPEKTILLFVFTSDKGLCGSFNNAVIDFAKKKITENADKKIEIHCYGAKGYAALKNFPHKVAHHPNIVASPRFDSIFLQSEAIMQRFTREQIDSVYLIYNQYHSILRQTPYIEQILPIQIAKSTKKVSENDYIYEPNTQTILSCLLPQIVHANLYKALLENSVGEQSARMTAMENASKNSKDLIEQTTLQLNMARQSVITTDIIEIISGTEAIR